MTSATPRRWWRKGLASPRVADLKGKRIAMPFNSTTHFHTMVALDQAKINPADVKILNMRPPEVRAAWQRGDIDATSSGTRCWQAKKDGAVVITSGQITAAVKTTLTATSPTRIGPGPIAISWSSSSR